MSEQVGVLPTLAIGEFDQFTDTIEIEGTRYSGLLFRDGFGINAMVGQVLRIDKHENGVVTVTKLLGEKDRAEFGVYCNGIPEAFTDGPRDQALKEAMHYAAQYAQDGEVQVLEIIRLKVEAPNYASERPAACGRSARLESSTARTTEDKR